MNIIQTTIILLIWLIAPYYNAHRDRFGRKPDYGKVWIARGFAFVGYWFLWTTDPKDGLLLFWVSVYSITIYWIVFELLLNLFTKKPWLHYDYQEGDSGVIDRFFKRLYLKTKTHAFHVAAKIICFALMVYSITRIYDLH